MRLHRRATRKSRGSVGQDAAFPQAARSTGECARARERESSSREVGQAAL
jgi:hypothetical protein